MVTQNSDHVPFDLRPYGYLKYGWKTDAERRKFRQDIRHLLLHIRDEPDKTDNPVSGFIPDRLRWTIGPFAITASAIDCQEWEQLILQSQLEYSDGFSRNDLSRLELSSFRPVPGQIGTYPQPGCTARVVEGTLQLGEPSEHAIASVRGTYLGNVAVQARFRLLDNGGDSSNWVGIQLRGFQPGIYGGYIVYVRSTGQVEVHSPEGEARALLQATPDADGWIALRVCIQDRRLRVELPGHQPQFVDGLNYVGCGWIAIEAFYAQAAVRDLQIYRVQDTQVVVESPAVTQLIRPEALGLTS